MGLEQRAFALVADVKLNTFEPWTIDVTDTRKTQRERGPSVDRGEHAVQIFFQFKFFLPDPVANDVKYQASAQPFLVFGLLTTALAIGSTNAAA